MLEDIRQISRDSRVSSREQRELDDRIYGELSGQYHKLLKILGKLNTLDVCMTLTNASLVSLLRTTTSSADTVSISSSTTPTYPSTLTDLEKADRVPEFGVIVAKRVNTRNVFTDDDGLIRPTITVTRSTDNSLYLESPDYIIQQNRVEHALEGDEPYIARFVRAGMTRSNINLDIRSTDQPFLINSMKYVPMPMGGAVMLERLRYDGVNPVVLNGSMEFQESSIYDAQRTLPGYIHFEPVETSLIRMAFSSELYNTTLNAVSVGISSLVGEYHTYSITSYIGYKVDFPDGYDTLKRVTLTSDGYALSLSNVTVRIYDSEDEFNAVSNRYVVSCGVDQQVTVPDPGTGSLYVLATFTSVNNTTPCLSGIDLQYQ